MPNVTSFQPDSTNQAAQETSTQRDLQRQALRELVQLSSESATTEANLEEDRAAALAAIESELKEGLAAGEACHHAEKASIEQKYQDFLAQVAASHQSDLNKLNEAQGERRLETERHSAAIDQDVRKKYAHATWLAETMLEGVQAQVREESQRASKDYAAQRARIEELSGHAQAVMASLGHWWAAPEWTQAVASPEEDLPIPGLEPDGADARSALGEALQTEATERQEPPQAPEVLFQAAYEQAEQRLDGIRAMRWPRLLAGVVPFVLTLAACLLAAGLTQVAISTTVPHWPAMGIAAGVVLVVMLVIGLLLRSMARAQVLKEADILYAEIEETIRSAQAELEFGQGSRYQRVQEAIQRRKREVQEAKDRYSPILRKAARDQEELGAAQQAEHQRLVAKIEAQRELGLKEARQWRETMLADAVQRHEGERREASERHDAALREARVAFEQRRQELERNWNHGLARIEEPIDRRQGTAEPAPSDWNASAWENWKPPRSFTSVVRFGEMQVDLKQVTRCFPKTLALPERFGMPALLAFPSQASLLVSTDHAGRAEAIRTLQMVMMRLLVSLPAGRVRFTIIDPIGLGQNFAGFMHLADYDEALVGGRIWTESDHIERRLADLTEHMETVIQKYLRNEFQTIDEYNAQAGELAEPYRFLVIADFPAAFSEDSLRRLASVVGTGARCGVYTLIARDTRLPMPAGIHLEELSAHSVNLVREGSRFVWKDEVFKPFPLALDSPPSEEFLTRTLQLVGREAREAKRVEVPFENIAPRDAQMWSRTTESVVEVPIGRMGATRLQTFRMGRGVAQHGLIAGKTGSGKSTLLHVLITNLSMWYSPDEIEFYLVDFKKGVEFKAYATHALPHARAVAVESDREFGLSVLQRVDAELGRRGTLFRKLGVQDLAAYRNASGEKMPRTLLMIDEFQEFFSEDDRIAQDAGLLLDRLVRQGRAFGIHVLLGSQTIGGTSGLARSTIGQMAIRIALQTSEADSQIILGDGNSAARLLSRPGEAIYNDMSGLVEANSPFQVAWLPDDTRDEFLTRVRERAQQQPHGRDGTVVFEGNVPGEIAKNEKLVRLMDAAQWPPATEAPLVWLGEPVAIKEPTAATLRRQSGANVLIIGQQDESAMALCASSMLSLAAQCRPGAARFYVLDGSPADSPLSKVFPQLKAMLLHELNLVEYRAVSEAMEEIATELNHRQGSSDLHPPAVYVIIYGLQRYRVLRKSEESFSFSARGEEAKAATDKQFADLLREGPPVGMHVIAWCDTPAAVERTLDRSSLREFDNRVLFQMSASDSSNLIDSPLANKLGQNRALVYSEEAGTLEKLRPYGLPTQEWLEHVRRQLAMRTEH